MGDNSIDISALQQYNEEYERELIVLATLGYEDLRKDFTLVPGVKDKYNLTQLKVNSIAKPYSRGWNAQTDKAPMTYRQLQVYLAESNLEEEPLAYRATYGAKFMRPGVNPEDHPFELEFQRETAKAFAEDLFLQTLFYGKRNAAGSNPVDICDGFFEILDTEIQAGNITTANGHLIETPVFDDTNALAGLKEMYRAVPKKFRTNPKVSLNMYMSYKTYEAYVDNYQSAVGGGKLYDTTFEKTFLEGSQGRCILTPSAAMGDSNKVIITPQSNMVVGVDGLENSNESFKTMGINPKVVGFFIAVAFGVQIGSLDWLWTNQQAGSGSASYSGSF
jgi:hypothetical protein